TTHRTGEKSFGRANATFDARNRKIHDREGKQRAKLGYPHRFCNPSLSERPKSRLKLCTAWPPAPFPRLSSALIRITRPVRGSCCQPMSMKLVRVTFFVSAHAPRPNKRTNAASL